MNIRELKHSQLEQLARHREALRVSPHLRWLFFEITSRCNLNCMHCGSSCSSEGASLTVQDVEAVLGTIPPDSDRPMICLTGGEPLMHPDWFGIGCCVRSMGFDWGMTTNAVLIDDAAARQLKRAGMATVSVSLDGLEETHDALRRHKGAWRLALRGLQALQDAGLEPQVTTVLHRHNFHELEPLFDLLCQMGITSWRPINVEPIGRACESGGLRLGNDQFADLLAYIREKRFDRSCNMEVTFGCSHYLGDDWERMVRDHYFLCGAGILTASIRSNGDICACLDVENRAELVQGNIRRDNFMEVWRSRFQPFRKDRTAECAKCLACSQRFHCGGDSAHTWDFGKNEPKLCYQDYAAYLK